MISPLPCDFGGECDGCISPGFSTSTELPVSVASPESGGDSRVLEEGPWVALVGTTAAAVLSGGFGPSLLKISVVVRLEGSGTPSLVASFVVVFTVVLIGGFDASSGVFFVVLGVASTSFPCLLCLAPSAFFSFPRVRMSLCWMRGFSHTSGFSLGPSASLSLVEGSCMIIPLSVKFFAGESLSVN